MKRGDWKTRVGMSGALLGSTLGGACDRSQQAEPPELQRRHISLDPTQFLGGVVITASLGKPIPPAEVTDEILRDFMLREIGIVLEKSDTLGVGESRHWPAVRTAHISLRAGNYSDALRYLESALNDPPRAFADVPTDRFPPIHDGHDIIGDCLVREIKVLTILDCLVNRKNLTPPSTRPTAETRTR